MQDSLLRVDARCPQSECPGEKRSVLGGGLPGEYVCVEQL